MTKQQLSSIDQYAKRTMSVSLDPQHDYIHVDKVRQNALKIVAILEIESEIDVNLLQAACLLHDILYTKHKPGFITWIRESRYLRRMLPGILRQFKLSAGDSYLVSEAVYTHTFAFPFRLLNSKYSLYAQIVQDADFIEFFATTRLIELKENKQFSKFYRVLSIFSGLFAKRMKKNADKYLNLPQILAYFQEEYV